MRHLIFCGNGCFFLCLEVRKSNIFEAVKESVTTRQAAEYYGVQVGRNGMACCPFHDDKHPSMKIDHRFHCFGCQADGDVIDFTARLFSLSSKEAALKLAEREIYQNATGEYPVLLLDDVLSELDPRRQEFVLNRIAGGQVFITCCEDDRLPVLLGGKVFHVKQGAIG